MITERLEVLRRQIQRTGDDLERLRVPGGGESLFPDFADAKKSIQRVEREVVGDDLTTVRGQL